MLFPPLPILSWWASHSRNAARDRKYRQKKSLFQRSLSSGTSCWSYMIGESCLLTELFQNCVQMWHREKEVKCIFVDLC